MVWVGVGVAVCARSYETWREVRRGRYRVSEARKCDLITVWVWVWVRKFKWRRELGRGRGKSKQNES
jgi:hypothetical protein